MGCAVLYEVLLAGDLDAVPTSLLGTEWAAQIFYLQMNS